jgi:NTP pyrophosphatase (non-canonical NTP hydrolase)
VSGSFTKHLDEVRAAVAEFDGLGVDVLSPRDGPPIRDESGFVYLRGDTGRSDEIEKRHLEAIERSDLLYIVNPNGYLGASVALEIGFAIAWRTPIWSSHEFAESPHNLLVRVGTPGEATNDARSRLKDLEFPVDDGLTELQSYVESMVGARGFEGETETDIFVLLVEEIGELAKAMRYRLQLKTAASDESHKNIRLELADCLIYLIHLSNRAGINLFAAMREKEQINASKRWVTQ